MNELLLFWSVLNGLYLHSAWPCKYTIVDSAYLFSLVVFMCQFDCITLGLSMLPALESLGLFAYVLGVCLLSTRHHVSRSKLGNFGHHHKVRQIPFD